MNRVLNLSDIEVILSDEESSSVIRGPAQASPPTCARPSPDRADHDDLQDCRSTSVATSLHLHSSVDDGPSPLQPGEHRAPVQSGEQGAGSRLEPAADPNPPSRPRSVPRANDQ